MLRFDRGGALVIAEIGGNPEGNFEVAKSMIGDAAKTGADFVKFQTYRPEKLVRPTEKWATKRFTKLAFSEEQFLELVGTAKKEGIQFLSTPFDLDAVDFLEPHMPLFKIGSGDITFHQMIRKIARIGKPMILSTGASSMEDIRAAVEVIKKENPSLLDNGQVAVMHCVCSYPTPPEQANLRSMIHIGMELGMPYGYSDHTEGITACTAAAAMGAAVIEKHFDVWGNEKLFKGGIYGRGDHILSAHPEDMTELVKNIRLIEKMLGDEAKTVGDAETGNQTRMRRCVTARVDIPRGTVLADEHLTALRPAEGGITADRYYEILGKKAKTDIKAGEAIAEDSLE